MNAIGALALLITILLFANADVRGADRICVTSDDEREHIRKIMMSALEEGFKKNVVHLFDVWIKEKAKREGRFGAGMNINVQAYNDLRAEALTWNPPLCSERK